MSRITLFLLVLLTLMGIALPAMPQSAEIRWKSLGQASSYGKERQGKLTSSGEVFDYRKFTAAHRTLPFGSIVLVTNLRNNKRVKVRINDRGPGIPKRIIDVSTAAANRLDFDGLTDVKIEVLYYGPTGPNYVYLSLRCREGQPDWKPCVSRLIRLPEASIIEQEDDNEDSSLAGRLIPISGLRGGFICPEGNRPRGGSVVVLPPQGHRDCSVNTRRPDSQSRRQ